MILALPLLWARRWADPASCSSHSSWYRHTVLLLRYVGYSYQFSLCQPPISIGWIFSLNTLQSIMKMDFRLIPEGTPYKSDHIQLEVNADWVITGHAVHLKWNRVVPAYLPGTRSQTPRGCLKLWIVPNSNQLQLCWKCGSSCFMGRHSLFNNCYIFSVQHIPESVWPTLPCSHCLGVTWSQGALDGVLFHAFWHNTLLWIGTRFLFMSFPHKLNTFPISAYQCLSRTVAETFSLWGGSTKLAGTSFSSSQFLG